MIKRKTLLVLGAGASQPFGFPTGAQLFDELCELAGMLPQPLVTLLGQFGHTTDDLGCFCAALRGSGVPSIDIFLSRRPEFSEIGRRILAGHIGACERLTRIDGADAGENWYLHLWDRMQHNAPDLASCLAGNRLRIITFNYDRSLEFFLHRAIVNSFGRPPDEAQQALARIEILHLFGCLAPFHYNAGPPYRGYEGPSTGELLRVAAEGIRVVPETHTNDEPFQKARTWLGWAEDVCFIGFGFNDWNTERLNFVSVFDYPGKHNKGAPQTFASVYGMTQVEREAARIRTIGGRGWIPLPMTSREFLRNIDALN